MMLITTSLLNVAAGSQTTSPIRVRVVAEVEAKSIEEGRETIRLIPATRVVPGDQVMYTLEIRNLGAADAVAATVTRAIPTHMAYLGDSASGPGADVTFSVDGGHSFEHPEDLHAKPMDYTHIRWRFKNNLKSKSVAFARFRAVVR